MTFLPGEFSIGIPIMNITSISHHPIRVGGSLAAALLVAGLQLSLVALPIGSLRAGGANEDVTLSPGKIFRATLQALPIVPIRTW